jgi:hypothetical protein
VSLVSKNPVLPFPPKLCRSILFEDSHSLKEKMEIQSGGGGWGWGGGVACERWNWQIPPISTAADASRDNRVRHLLHCRTVECLP